MTFNVVNLIEFNLYNVKTVFHTYPKSIVRNN